MKRTFKLITLSAILLLLVGSFFSCKDKEGQIENLPFEVYSQFPPNKSNPTDDLLFVPCWWGHVGSGNSVIVINNDEEMKKYANCPDGFSYPEIDFSKYTLLLAKGIATSGIATLEKQFQRISANKYALCVDIRRGTITIQEGWIISIKVSKLPQNTKVTLNLNEHY